MVRDRVRFWDRVRDRVRVNVKGTLSRKYDFLDKMPYVYINKKCHTCT